MSSKSRKQELYEQIKRSVLTLDLQPGSDLDEVVLSEQYGISRTPLRDVFRQLAGEGYLEIRNNRGASVASMSHNTLRDFFLVAPMIYSAIGRLAANNATAAQIEKLKDVQIGFRRAKDLSLAEELVYFNDRFHSIMGEMANNVYLMPSLRRLLIDHARIGQTFYRPKDGGMASRLEIAADQHDEFIALIEAGDEEGVVALVEEHWALSRDHIELFITPASLPTNFRLRSSG
ncbi:MAG: GntR family transcriptional regulator [Cohaesibacter sp.]|jgi:DNA-binding GntR family transcriptional regulator|nr:GntR family transcriptional regulator [Cohaesibacter sp.]